MSGTRITRRGTYPAIVNQPRSRPARVVSAPVAVPDELRYEDTIQQEGFVGESYHDELIRAITNLHEDCRSYLDEHLGIDPDLYGNYLVMAETIIRTGYDAYGSVLTEDQAQIYRGNAAIQRDLRSMVDNYREYPIDIQDEFRPQARAPVVRSRPRPSGGSRFVAPTYDGEAQREEASMMLNQQSHITDLQAYQTLTRPADTSFGLFQVDEAPPPPWPTRIPIVPNTYSYTSPGTPRRLVSAVDPYSPRVMPVTASYTPRGMPTDQTTPRSNRIFATPVRTPTTEVYTPRTERVIMTPSRVPLPESPMTPGFRDFNNSVPMPRMRNPMEAPGSARRALPAFVDNYTPATSRRLFVESTQGPPQSTPAIPRTPRITEVPSYQPEQSRIINQPIIEEVEIDELEPHIQEVDDQPIAGSSRFPGAARTSVPSRPLSRQANLSHTEPNVTTEIPVTPQAERTLNGTTIQEYQTPASGLVGNTTTEVQPTHEDGRETRREGSINGYGTPRSSVTAAERSPEMEEVDIAPENLERAREAAQERRQARADRRPQPREREREPEATVGTPSDAISIPDRIQRDVPPHINPDPTTQNWRTRTPGRTPYYATFLSRPPRPYSTNNRPVSEFPDREPRRYAQDNLPAAGIPERTPHLY
jgi:hypothetical protein